MASISSSFSLSPNGMTAFIAAAWLCAVCGTGVSSSFPPATAPPFPLLPARALPPSPHPFPTSDTEDVPHHRWRQRATYLLPTTIVPPLPSVDRWTTSHVSSTHAHRTLVPDTFACWARTAAARGGASSPAVPHAIAWVGWCGSALSSYAPVHACRHSRSVPASLA